MMMGRSQSLPHPLLLSTQVRARKRSYQRKRSIPATEQQLQRLKQQRQQAFLQVQAKGPASIWSFESLFPQAVLDEESIQKDLQYYAENSPAAAASVASQNSKSNSKKKANSLSNNNNHHSKMKSSLYGGSAMMRLWREQKLSSAVLLPLDRGDELEDASNNGNMKGFTDNIAATTAAASTNATSTTASFPKVDFDLTRLVEDHVFGYRRGPNGGLRYDTSLLPRGQAVQFRQGVRLGNPLKVNADLLTAHAKKELQHGRIEEAVELYERAVQMDPRDGRAYLGLANCAARRGDFALQRQWLVRGTQHSVSVDWSRYDERPDRGANPFLLQALGCWEENMGHLSEAEHWYKAAVQSRPSHAAAWVALAQIRTRKLGQSAAAGRVCFETAERELTQAGKPPSSYVYTAWANLEFHKANDLRRARQLFQKALKLDPKCSAAWLQLGVLEAKEANWDEAENCFETVLKFDQRNSRVLQAYALMETKRPGGDSRRAIGLFERALQVNPRDAGVLQPYALYVAELGDLDMARELLRRGTEVNKRHAPVWQAWGVLETRHGCPEKARHVFQQGIWACGQLTGSQSGGHHCARLWQAWGVLEAQEGDFAAARRCFSRALDSNARCVPAYTAWAFMEAEQGQIADARAIFECALDKFAAGSKDKISLWRSYEIMEQRSIGDVVSAQNVYQRSVRENFALGDQVDDGKTSGETRKFGSKTDTDDEMNPVLLNEVRPATENPTDRKEVEVVRWESTGGEVWMNDRAIEGKMPMSPKKQRGQKRTL